jgi:hypothetical protein
MKTYLLLFISMLGALICSAQSPLSLGLRFSPAMNFSKMEGSGMASGRFELVPLGTAVFGLMAQYEFNKRWALEGGFNLTSAGFSTEFRNDYAVGSKPDMLRTKHEFTVLQLPLAAVWRGKLNCRNWRSYLKAGVLLQTHWGNQRREREELVPLSTSTQNAHLNITSASQPFASGGFLLGLGREKVRKSGARFNWGVSLILNGANTIHGTVDYHDANQSFTHTLVNKGHYFCVDFMYYFKPLKSSSLSKNSF